MATESLSLASVISSAWTETGSTGLGCVNTSDGDTTYITTNSALLVNEYKFTAPATIGATDTISNVRLGIEVRKTSGSLTTGIKAVVGTNASTASTFVTTTTYTVFTADFPLNPTGGAWTLTDLSDLRIQIQNTVASLTQARITNVTNAVVTFTAGATGINKGLFFALLT